MLLAACYQLGGNSAFSLCGTVSRNQHWQMTRPFDSDACTSWQLHLQSLKSMLCSGILTGLICRICFACFSACGRSEEKFQRIHIKSRLQHLLPCFSLAPKLIAIIANKAQSWEGTGKTLRKGAILPLKPDFLQSKVNHTLVKIL